LHKQAEEEEEENLIKIQELAFRRAAFKKRSSKQECGKNAFSTVLVFLLSTQNFFSSSFHN